MSISIQAGTTTPSAAGASTGATAGTDLQRAYRAASKDLRDAQQQLAKDTTARASEDTIKAGQLAVQMAQAAVAQAAAAIAKANADAQQKEADDRTPERNEPAAATSPAPQPSRPTFTRRFRNFPRLVASLERPSNMWLSDELWATMQGVGILSLQRPSGDCSLTTRRQASPPDESSTASWVTAHRVPRA